MKRVMITDPVYEGMTGEVVSVCTDGQHPMVKIKLDADGSFLFLFLDEFVDIKGEKDV